MNSPGGVLLPRPAARRSLLLFDGVINPRPATKAPADPAAQREARRTKAVARAETLKASRGFNLGGLSAERRARQAKVTRKTERVAVLKTGGKFLWRWEKHKCRANTKSEARARFKQSLGLAKLPPGANVVKVDA